MLRVFLGISYQIKLVTIVVRSQCVAGFFLLIALVQQN